MTIEDQIKDILRDTLGLEDDQEIKPSDSLINDLDADSIDFLDILFHIEKKMGVKVDSTKFNISGFDVNDPEFVQDFKLTKSGAEKLQAAFPERKERYVEGTAMQSLFRSITVYDFISLIRSKIISDYISLKEQREFDYNTIFSSFLLTEFGFGIIIKYLPELKDDLKPGMSMTQIGDTYSKPQLDATLQKLLKDIKPPKL